MSGANISHDVCALLRDVVDSIEKLQIVVLLRRGPGVYASDAIARMVSIAHDTAVLELRELRQAGLLRSDEHGAWCLATGGWDHAVDGLVELHDCQPLELMKWMNHLAIERVRTFKPMT